MGAVRRPSWLARALAVLGSLIFAAAVACWVVAAFLSDTRWGHAGAALLVGVAGAFAGAAFLSQKQPHHYISTACQHDLHERCRLVCKYCSTACWCFCHELEDEDEDEDE